jgi:hypothetical protein
MRQARLVASNERQESAGPPGTFVAAHWLVKGITAMEARRGTISSSPSRPLHAGACGGANTRSGGPKTRICGNAVEGFFAKLTRRRLKHGVFSSVTDLQAAINRFVAEHNQDPKPFVWRKNPTEIIAAVNRGYQTLESIH